MAKLLLGLLLFIMVMVKGGIEDVIAIDEGLNEGAQVKAPEPDPDAPIVNNQPDVVPNSYDYDSESWFEHKYMAATFESHMMSIIIVAALSFIGLGICIVYGCKRIKRNKVNTNDDDDYNTEVDNVERQPFT